MWPHGIDTGFGIKMVWGSNPALKQAATHSSSQPHSDRVSSPSGEMRKRVMQVCVVTSM